MTGVDTSRPPLGERAAQSLVAAVVASDDRVEDHYLEVKSGLDLTTKKDQAKLAKFILGAANRMPDDSAKHFDGYAVMVIGASQGAAAGVAPIEALDIEKAVSPFLGAEGPAWDIARVPVPGSANEVLLLIVDPPKWGQAPFVCQKDGGDGGRQDLLRDGAIYYRARGETREAKAGELTRLLRRGMTATTPQVDLDVRVLGRVARVDRDALRTVCEEFVEFHKSRLMLALALSKQPKKTSEPGFGRASLAGLVADQLQGIQGATTRPEERTEDQYRSEVIMWVQQIRDVWPAVIERFLAGVIPTARIEVANRGETFFEDASLTVHVPGEVYGLEPADLEQGANASDLDIPQPPRAWGPRTVDFAAQFRASVMPAIEPLIRNYDLPNLSRTSWSNSGSLDLTFDVGALRPLEVDMEDVDVALITGDSLVSEFFGSWRLTARGHHAVYKGEVTIEVDESIDLVAMLRDMLELPPHGGHGS